MSGDIACPLCEYNLRGLAESRCPECGYRFEWAELIDAHDHRHPYLFEHHPRRNVWSLRKTAVGGLRPWRFWSSLRPDQISEPRRLVAYWVTAMFITLCLILVTCVGYWVEDTARYNINPPAYRRMSIPVSPYGRSPRMAGTPRSYFDVSAFSRKCGPLGQACLIVWTMAAIWPWVTAGILMIFRASMRQARIKPIHILRCVLYSGDSVMWAAFAVAVIAWLAAGRTVVTQSDLPASLWLSFIGVIGLAFPLFSVVKLCAACQYYLRFRHAWATVAASQIILILAALVVVTNFDYYLLGRLV